MNAGMVAMLQENLRFLKLSAITKNLENVHRQALENKLSYDEFLLNLTEIEVQVRKENGRKKRIREAAFPLHKPLETSAGFGCTFYKRSCKRQLSKKE
jgi:DNA replication protein DnaC